jgi:hypothetical protein
LEIRGQDEIMGYMRHHAIIVTSEISPNLNYAHLMARSIFGESRVSSIVLSSVNCVCSFFVSPDGSKEGWDESRIGDEQRDEFIAYLRREAYEDGSNSLTWAEVQYGDDDHESAVVRSGDMDYCETLAKGGQNET